MSDPDLTALATEMETLTQAVEDEGARIAGRWSGWLSGSGYAASAANLSHYLALRRHDLRPLQERLMVAGLSSLGRAESRVMPTLQAVRHLLSQAGAGTGGAAQTAEGFFAGQAAIQARADALLGQLSPESPVRLMVTLPSEAATDGDFILRLARLGVEAVRINCAHDGPDVWGAMVAQVRRAEAVTGWRMRVAMDLPGPKIRTGEVREGKGGARVKLGDDLAITRPGRLAEVPKKLAAVECTLDTALQATEPGHRVFLDDGKLAVTVHSVEGWGLLARIDAGPDDKGYKLKPEKGINFPDSDLAVPALTDDDRAILPFVAANADVIDYSFVQRPEDVADLQAALAALRPDDWQRIGLVLKVETRAALRNLPDMIVRAAGQQPTGVMIARGDLAVEIGFARVAEMQEEILWLCEAAQVPVIWATQVMESFLKTGVPSRGEMTDAAMAARAECVMLNKGPYLFDGIAMLDRLHDRMGGHMAKKAHLLRPLTSW
jgi:pyruvate kinase